MNVWILIVGGSIAIILCVVLFTLMIFNRASDKSWSLFFTLTGSLIAATILFCNELLAPLDDDVTDVQTIIIYDGHLRPAPIALALAEVNSEHTEFYRYILEANLGGDENVKFPTDDPEKFKAETGYALNLMESAFWRWQVEHYPDNWLIERQIFRGMSGWGGGMTWAKDAEARPRIYSPMEVGLNKGNSLISDRWPIAQFVVPSGSTVSVVQDSFRRITTVHIRHLTFIVEMTYAGGGGLGKISFVSRLMDELDPPPKEWQTANVNVRFRTHYNKWLRWSPDTTKQKRWISEMVEMWRRDFAWDGIREDLEKYIALKGNAPKFIAPDTTLPPAPSNSGEATAKKPNQP